MFKGSGTAIITPYDNEQNIDYSALRKLVNFQIESNIDSIIVLGTTGETPVLSFEEKEKILETVVEETNKRVPLIVGTGSNNTKEVVKMNKQAEKYGIEGLLIVNPYYNKGTQESIIKHYEYISEHTELPIMLYNVPYRTGMNITPDTVVKIADKCKNVVAIKEASSNISQIAELFSIIPEGFKVFSGNDDQALPIMAMGGEGVISVFANAYPKHLKQITDSFFLGDLKKSQYYSNLYMKMMNLMFIETSPAPLKYVMSLLGLCQNVLRLPLDEVTEKTKVVLKNAVENFPKV